jgi:negative regulator of replication initiation
MVAQEQIYTQVALRALQQVYVATHPAALLDHGENTAPKAIVADAEALFSTLEAEAEEDREEPDK